MFIEFLVQDISMFVENMFFDIMRCFEHLNFKKKNYLFTEITDPSIFAKLNSLLSGVFCLHLGQLWIINWRFEFDWTIFQSFLHELNDLFLI
jgi:hypothetical protein